MEIWQAIVLGIVQGLTEFLPISSSAHLIIFPWLLDWETPGLSFDAALHLGTLAAVLVYFRQEITRMIAAIPRALSNPLGLLMGRVDAIGEGMTGHEVALFASGAISAGVVGFLAISGLLRFLANRSTLVFVVYRIGFGLLLLAILAVR